MPVEIDPAALAGPLAALLARRAHAMGRASVALARTNTPDHPDTPTAEARDSIEYEVDADAPDGPELRFGSRLLKFRFLELGTVDYAPRAPLRRALDELGPEYRRIAGGR